MIDKNFEGQNFEPKYIDVLKNQDAETHIYRYLLASHWCKEADVCDVSCGYGYGSVLLKTFGANSVIGLDIDSQAIEYAKKNYPICDFKTFDVLTELPKELENRFDTVVSIETFEHLPRHLIEVYLNNLKKMVKEGGKIFITTPKNRQIMFSYNNGSHLYEYNVEEFLFIIGNAFGGATLSFLGIKEIRINTQLVSVWTPEIIDSRVMVAVIENVKH